MTRTEHIELLREEYRNLTKQEIEIHKRKAIIEKTLDKLEDEEALKRASGGRDE